MFIVDRQQYTGQEVPQHVSEAFPVAVKLRCWTVLTNHTKDIGESVRNGKHLAVFRFTVAALLPLRPPCEICSYLIGPLSEDEMG